MSYKIKRSELNAMKRRYGAENETDKEFLEWWRRNHGTGYEAFELIEIVEDEKEVKRPGQEPLIEVHRTSTHRLLIPKSCKKNFDKFFG